MATLSPDDKKTTVMLYTQTMLVRGDLITKQAVRVSTWLRTQGVPEYIHVHSAQTLIFGSGGVKSMNYKEIFVPTGKVVAFHLAPPAADPVDYAADELNRVMVPVTVHVGTFLFKGSLRISSKADFATNVELAHSSWMSIYDSDVANPYMPQMQSMHVPLVLVSPKEVNIALEL